jgi:hypothetical protein
MKEFLMLFRMDAAPSGSTPSPEQMQASMKHWQDWMGGIAAQNKLANPGNRLSQEGKVLKSSNTLTDGPYADVKELVGGYIIVRAVSLEDAAGLAANCPILSVGGNVEIRPIIPMDAGN